MTLKAFADKYKLKAKKSPDDDNNFVINGRHGQIYDYSEFGDGDLAVSFTPGLDKDRRGIGTWTPKRWNRLRDDATAIGMVVRQDGDSEGALSFDPLNREQAKFAIKMAGAKAKRTLSAAQMSNPALFRKSAEIKGHLAT